MGQGLTTIYIVDDDASVRRSLARLMRAAGYRAEEFESTEQFLTTPSLDSPACILADVRMPGSSGVDLPRRLHGLGLSVPVILLSACDSPETRAMAKTEGVSGYFRKPVDDQALIDAIEWAINKVA